MVMLVLVVLVTLLISFVCSLFEATLFSTQTGTLEASVATGRKVRPARQFLDMKRNIAVPIAAILILNTAAHTMGAAAGGYYSSVVLGTDSVLWFSVVFTLLMLYITEILPKTLGAVHWRTIWPHIVWPLTVMKYTLYPLIAVSQRFADLLSRGQVKLYMTEDEILAVVRRGAQEGQITQDESVLVHNIIGLENRAVHDIMTPRTVMFMLDANLSVQQAIKAVDGKGFTRIPIYEDDRENVIGYIIIHDLFSTKTLENPDQPIKSIAKPISFAPESRGSLALLTSFLKSRQHIAVVVDEFGGIAGLVTLEDLIETLLGKEIVDETDRVVDLQERARQLRRQLPPS